MKWRFEKDMKRKIESKFKIKAWLLGRDSNKVLNLIQIACFYFWEKSTLIWIKCNGWFKSIWAASKCHKFQASDSNHVLNLFRINLSSLKLSQNPDFWFESCVKFDSNQSLQIWKKNNANEKWFLMGCMNLIMIKK